VINLHAKEILFFIVFPLIVISIFTSFSMYFIIKKRKQLIYNKVFESVKNSVNNIVQLHFKNNDCYDIYLETQYSRYFIKIISDTKNKILHVDKDLNFYLLNKPTDQLINKLDVNDFVRLSNLNSDKRNNKIIVLYPSVSQKVYYESKVNAKFIYPDFEIENTHVIEYNDIEEFFENSEI